MITALALLVGVLVFDRPTRQADEATGAAASPAASAGGVPAAHESAPRQGAPSPGVPAGAAERRQESSADPSTAQGSSPGVPPRRADSHLADLQAGGASAKNPPASPRDSTSSGRKPVGPMGADDAVAHPLPITGTGPVLAAPAAATSSVTGR